MTPIEKHEKAILILLNIAKLEDRISAHSKLINQWSKDRVKIDNKIKEKLTNYYNQL